MSDKHEEIVIDFSREMNDEEGFRILRKICHAFPTFVREFGSLLLLTGAFGALQESHPSWATKTLFAVTALASFVFLINVFVYRLRIQIWKEVSTRWQWWTTKLLNIVVLTACTYVASQLYFEVRDLLAPIAASAASGAR